MILSTVINARTEASYYNVLVCFPCIFSSAYFLAIILNQLHLQNGLNECPVPSRLVLKKGAQVMLLKNISVPMLVNGSRGVIIDWVPANTAGVDLEMSYRKAQLTTHAELPHTIALIDAWVKNNTHNGQLFFPKVQFTDGCMKLSHIVE